MRIPPPLVVFFGSFLAVAGCASPKRPPQTSAVTTEPRPIALLGSLPIGDGIDDSRDGIPRVIRRILSEEKELVSRSLALAGDLPDPRGRQRALTEAQDLARELSEIEAPLDGADSDTLDDLVATLLRIDTRVALLHEKLRTAANRETAVLVE